MCIISVYMQTQRINITLPISLIRRLRTFLPKRSRSKFIAEAVEESLKKKKNLKEEWIKSLKANYELDRKISKEWEVTLFDGLQEEEW